MAHAITKRAIEFKKMVGKGPELVRYDEYLTYVAAGELDGTLSHDEWLARQGVQ